MRPAAIRPSELLTFVLFGAVAISVAMAQTPAKGPIAVSFTAVTDNVSGAGERVKINLSGWSTDAERDQLVAAWTSPTAPGGGARGGGARGGAGAGRGAGGRGRGGAAPAATDAALPVDPADPDNPPAGRGGRGGRGGGGNGAADAAPPPTPDKSMAAALQKIPTVGILWASETTGYSLHYAYRLPQPDGGERIILATDRRLGAWNNLWKPTGTAEPADYGFTIIELRLNSKGEGEGKASLTGKIAVDSEAKTMALDGYSALPVVFKGVKRQNGN